MITETTLSLGRSELVIDIEYTVSAAEYADDVYPGCPREATLIGVYVEWWRVVDDDRHRGDSWHWKQLDELARDVVGQEWDYFGELCIEDAVERGREQ